MLIGVHHPDFNFNLADPSTSYIEMRTYSNLTFGFHLANYRCAWCNGALCVFVSVFSRFTLSRDLNFIARFVFNLYFFSGIY